MKKKTKNKKEKLIRLEYEVVSEYIDEDDWDLINGKFKKRVKKNKNIIEEDSNGA